MGNGREDGIKEWRQWILIESKQVMIDDRKDGKMVNKMDGRIDGWINGWMDGLIERFIELKYNDWAVR